MAMPEYVRAGLALRAAEAEARVRQIVREEIAAYFASVSRSAVTAPAWPSYADYLRERDEPPAAPPVPTPNATEPL